MKINEADKSSDKYTKLNVGKVQEFWYEDVWIQNYKRCKINGKKIQHPHCSLPSKIV